MKRPSQQKLYSRLSNLSLPDHVQEFRGGRYSVKYQNIAVMAHVCWPSGKPCLAINMYLLDNNSKWTGDSVMTTASKLSELVRYCAHGRANQTPCSFSDLNDNDIARLKEKLCSDTYIDAPLERLRNNNTVRAIMQSMFSFLVWYQDNLHLRPGRLIGTSSEGSAITVKRKLNPHNNCYYFYHRYLPPSESTDPKLPISTTMIEHIEAVIDELEYPESYPEAALRRFGGDDELLQEYLGYITARRNFMVFMMRTSGLRPEEMARMPLLENNKSVRAKIPMLILPTMKRRMLNPPLREFPITIKQAMRVRLYLRSRKAWIDCCKKINPKLTEPKSMFLSTEPGNLGKGVGKGALHKDFEKLCNRADYRNHQSCFSMFRHKFITDLVVIHLKAFNNQTGELNRQDYRSLLEKVREKTGHKSINSLWHYIDLAQNLAGVWDPVDKAISRTHAAEELSYELRQLRRDLRGGVLNQMPADQIIDHISMRIEQIISDTKSEFNNSR